MTMGRMQPERFERLLDAHGADARRWPDAERKAALEFLMASPEARRLRAEAAKLDRLLDAVPPIEPSSELEARILAGAPTAWKAPAEPRAGGMSGAGRGKLVAGALAASLILGFVTGVSLQPESDTADPGDLLQLAQLGETYQDF